MEFLIQYLQDKGDENWSIKVYFGHTVGSLQTTSGLHFEDDISDLNFLLLKRFVCIWRHILRSTAHRNFAVSHTHHYQI
jgi:hypothetical protein